MRSTMGAPQWPTGLWGTLRKFQPKALSKTMSLVRVWFRHHSWHRGHLVVTGTWRSSRLICGNVQAPRRAGNNGSGRKALVTGTTSNPSISPVASRQVNCAGNKLPSYRLPEYPLLPARHAARTFDQLTATATNEPVTTAGARGEGCARGGPGARSSRAHGRAGAPMKRGRGRATEESS